MWLTIYQRKGLITVITVIIVIVDIVDIHYKHNSYYRYYRYYIKWMSQYFPKPYELSGRNINIKLDLSNYATKAELKNATVLINLK